ncbi:MAG: GreA/GreB family elongation factor [Dethiobacter sp.]|nr:GreA/GreB family elongation factor [Dethiobacter sp.]MCL5981503.1 GreA/GreB family elongation factor [Bacillota bacterium]
MAKVTLSKATFENLVKHLVEIEDGKKKLLEEYYPEQSTERNEIEMLIDNYIKRLDQLIRNAKRSQTTDNKVPFVTIGSEVEIQDLSDLDVFKYRIVSPFRGSIREGDVSYLSPVGKSLLFKKVGDEVEVIAPGGVFLYKIKSILLQG